jgi:hypothetical protein
MAVSYNLPAELCRRKSIVGIKALSNRVGQRESTGYQRHAEAAYNTEMRV